MLTQHEIFGFAALLVVVMFAMLRLQGVKGEDLTIGAFYITGVAVTGLLLVLEVVLLIGGLL